MTEAEFASMKKADDLSAWEVVLIAEVERLRKLLAEKDTPNDDHD